MKKQIFVALVLAIIFVPFFTSAQINITLINQLKILVTQLQAQLARLQTTTLPLSVLTSVLPTKYGLLLNNQKINAAVTQSGNFLNSEIDFLQDKVLELENNNTQNWNQFLHPQPFSEQEMRKMWLQQVALSLYIEVNKIVPWSILSYGDESLDLLLAYPTESYYSFTGPVSFSVFNHNPIIPRIYAEEINNLYPNEHNTPRDFLYSVVMMMRNDGWIHASGDPYYEACNFSNEYPLTFSCVSAIKRGTSTYTPLFIKSVLAAYNIPSQLIRPYFGHGGIFFPTVLLAMDGDAPYNSYLTGLRLRPNKIPVENSFIDLNLVKKWLVMPVCQGSRLKARTNVLAYLALYDKPGWREDLIASYNFNPNGSYRPGQWLKENAISGTIPNLFCQNTDPAAPNYWVPILSESEWASWLNAIASSLSPTPSLYITSPTAATVWQSNVVNNIAWTSSGFSVPATVDIAIQRSSDNQLLKEYTGLTGMTVESGSFSIPANDLTAGSRIIRINARSATPPHNRMYLSSSDVFTVETPSTYALTTAVSPADSGTINLSPNVKGNSYPAGTSVNLTAIPTVGYTFNRWSVAGFLGRTANPTSVLMDRDMSVTANFAVAPTTYTITASATTGGVISPSGVTTVYAGGSETYTIAPNAGYRINDVLANGSSIGPTYTYRIYNVQSDQTIQANFTAIAPTITITSSSPPDGAIDARNVNPSKPSFKDVVLTFSGSAAGVTAADFSVLSSSASAPSVLSVAPSGNNATLTLSRPLNTQERVKITYTPSGDKVCLGFLPGDVNGGSTSVPADQLALIDSLNGVTPRPIYSTDIDRSTVAGPSDITALVDLLNGAGAGAGGTAWLNKTLPACPGGGTGVIFPQTQYANILSALSSLLQNLRQVLTR